MIGGLLFLAAVSAQAQAPQPAVVPMWSLEAQRRLTAGLGIDLTADLRERQRLVQVAELALAAGDAETALQTFERAAAMVHSPDVELGIVRSHMQAGEYRRALMFAAHAAGAHRQVSAGTAMYAWLLHLGGQSNVARRLLDDALELVPQEASLQQARQLLTDPRPRPSREMMVPPLRAAPYAHPAEAAAGTQAAGSALLLPSGLHALASAASLQGARRVWVRTGGGQTMEASWQISPNGPALALLQWSAALPALALLPTAATSPFAGSPAYTAAYVNGDSTDPAWPLLKPGFFGRWLAAPGDRLLGIELPPGPRGSPVFDRQGRLAGLALPGADGRDRLLGAQAMMAWLQEQQTHIAQAWTAAPPPAAEPVAMPLDELYETALRVTLQVLVER